MSLELDGDGALNRQVYRAVLAAIASGTLRRGERLWSSRQLQQHLGVSRNVVLMALSQLIAEGHLETRRGAGTYVSSHPVPKAARRPSAARKWRLGNAAAALAAQSRFDIGGLHLQALGQEFRFDFRYARTHLPTATQMDWIRLTRRDSRFAFERCSPTGHPELQRAVAAYLRRSRGVVADPQDILITNGVQEALDLTVRLLVPAGATVVVEDPHYRPFSLLAHAHGAKVLPLPVDEHGLRTEGLPEKRRCALAYVTPSHQFPTGHVLSQERREALLAWAERTDALLLEDDYDGEFRYDSRPLAPLKQLDAGGRVIHVGSMSKVLSPALRLGYAVLPAGLMPHYAALKEVSTGSAATHPQRTLARFIQQGAFERHLRRLRRIYAERRAALTAAIDTHLAGVGRYQGSCGGIHLLLWVDAVRAVQWREFLSHAARGQVATFAATSLFARPPRALPLVLAYGGIATEAIEPGIRALAGAIASYGAVR